MAEFASFLLAEVSDYSNYGYVEFFKAEMLLDLFWTALIFGLYSFNVPTVHKHIGWPIVQIITCMISILLIVIASFLIILRGLAFLFVAAVSIHN